MTRRRLPLAGWAGLLTSGAVLLSTAGIAAALAADGRLDRHVLRALSLGSALGLALSVLAVLAARGVARGLRALHDEAVRRLQQPSAPIEPARRPVVVRSTAELAELAGVLQALHLRVRVGDGVADQHRREAETAGAGVFELLSGLVAAEEGARGQLSAELHDTVAQSLMIARGLLAERPSTPAQWQSVRSHVDDAEEQVRAVMARTRPPALREGDLAAAVDDLSREMVARYGLTVAVSWPATAHPLPLASAVTVYRFFQEALLNVVKHADVDDARVELVIDDDIVLATVSDDGPGFDLAFVRPERGRHVGLGLMRERARLSGGDVEVTSAPGEGTTLTLRLPRPHSVAPPLDALVRHLPSLEEHQAAA